MSPMRVGVAALTMCTAVGCHPEGFGEAAEGAAAARTCEALARRPVLFVHGSGLSSASWDAMRAHLRAAGYPQEWLVALDLRPDNGANERAARRFIEPAARRLLSTARRRAREAGCEPPRKLDLVAHSMGAVSTRWYAARIAPETVHTWIGIAGSNHGTDRLCGHAGEGNREMCPAFAPSRAASAVQFELNGSPQEPRDETPYGVGPDAREAVRVPPTPARAIRYFTLRIEPDEWIEPATSALLDGAGAPGMPRLPAQIRATSPGNLLLEADVRHDPMPAHPAVIEAVAALLTDTDAR